MTVRGVGDGRIIAGPFALGEITIERREYRDALPPGVDPLRIRLGELALLQDVALELREKEVLVHLVWQVEETTLTNYTAFVHLRDGGRVIAADDRQPFPPTSYWTPGEVILETYTLQRPAPGTYDVAVGLYDAANGTRLHVREVDGQTLADDQLVLPLEAP